MHDRALRRVTGPAQTSPKLLSATYDGLIKSILPNTVFWYRAQDFMDTGYS